MRWKWPMKIPSWEIFTTLFLSFMELGRAFIEKTAGFLSIPGDRGGKMGDFEITHTFGWYPLQQYLVPFPGGRLQCLPIAWNVEERKWYHLYPKALMDSNDWLYWTNAGQNWNGMCAECHSTNLKKNYDLKTDTYRTTWSDIDVGCESCHGPGSNHVEWAEMPDMARPRAENFKLTMKTSGISSSKLVELCAPCHSRRAALGDYTHTEPDLLDSLLPSLLTENLYFADGQILEEVYVYGSFTQSKMYHRDVRCNDCHEVHSLKLVKAGNDLCFQCHRAHEYDTKAHHFHKKKGEKGKPIRSSEGKVLFHVGTGAECVQCHMPGRNYMGIDYRPDHSFRIPPSRSQQQDWGARCLHALPHGQNFSMVRQNHHPMVRTGAQAAFRYGDRRRPQKTVRGSEGADPIGRGSPLPCNCQGYSPFTFIRLSRRGH